MTTFWVINVNFQACVSFMRKEVFLIVNLRRYVVSGQLWVWPFLLLPQRTMLLILDFFNHVPIVNLSLQFL